MDYSEVEIFAGVRNGDIAAFEQLYRKYYTFFRLIAFHIVRNYDDAEEIVSEVFVKLWNNRNEIEISSSVKAYITRSVQNTAINFVKKQASAKSVTNSLDDSDYCLLAWDSDYPLGQLYEKDVIEILKKNIPLLPDGCRKVYLMSRNREFTYNDIAERLGISVNTVKMQMKIALSRLRDALADYITISIIFIGLSLF
jgi:RNA polymerase sigma-70 factor (ECF subfamily)